MYSWVGCVARWGMHGMCNTCVVYVVQFLLANNISYDPENLFEDVQSTIYSLHTSGKVHQEIASDLGEGVVVGV